MLKSMIRKFTPAFVIAFYHFVLAWVAALRYRFPSKDMVVIGVTGTSGKSTTCYFLARMLEALGDQVGMATTIMFKVGEKEWLNDKKMTMVGRFQLQKLLREMADAGCKYAIVETTSEGIKQFRHKGIAYDIAVFTNLYPEHLLSHGGSFEKYKATKLKLFRGLVNRKHKIQNGHVIPHTIVANIDDEHATDFLNFDVDDKVTFSKTGKKATLEARHGRQEDGSIRFEVDGTEIVVGVLGEHNIWNALAAMGAGLALGKSIEDMADAFAHVQGVPGRIEQINEGQNFHAIVDYAFEPRALKKLYETIRPLHPKRIIHVTGAAGGGRDTDKRPIVGAYIAENADVMIVTNEDPYDEPPTQIIEQVAAGAEQIPEQDRAEVLTIIDRGEAIQKAVSLAQAGDLVLVTGKASEQAIVVAGGKLIPWDDRTELRNAIQSYASAT